MKWAHLGTNDLVGKCVFIDFIGKIIIDFAGYSVIYNMAGKILNDLENKWAKLKNYYWPRRKNKIFNDMAGIISEIAGFSTNASVSSTQPLPHNFFVNAPKVAPFRRLKIFTTVPPPCWARSCWPWTRPRRWSSRPCPWRWPCRAPWSRRTRGGGPWSRYEKGVDCIACRLREARKLIT